MTITSKGVLRVLGRRFAETNLNDLGLARLAYVVPSDQAEGTSEILDFLGTVPAFEKWLTNRQNAQPVEYDFSIKNEKFETSFHAPMRWINNDKTGLVAMKQDEMIKRYREWPAELIAALIVANETGLCFTGEAMCANAHTFGKGTCDNLITYDAAAAGAPTPLEAAEGILAGINQMIGFTDDHGKPMNEGISKVTVACPHGAMSVAHMQAVHQKLLSTGSGTVDNPLQGLENVKVELVVSARITALTDKILVVNTSPGARPFIFMENKKDFALTAKAEGSDYEHDKDGHAYGAKSVGNAGFGMPQDVTNVQYV